MHIVNDFKRETEQVLEACSKRISCYSPGIRELAWGYLEKLHLTKGDNASTGGFCYLMPWWLKPAFGLDAADCHTIALGNIFGLLYFMSQDEVMDSGAGEYKGHILPLSGMFFYDFISSYHKLFESTSPFWGYFERYMGEWTGSVNWECRQHRGVLKPYTTGDFIMMSRKSAPLKIPFAALCLKAGRQQDIGVFSDFVDYDQVAYQIIDDWRDWKEDLRRGNYSFFLTQAASYCNIGDPADLNATHVRKAILLGDAAEAVFAVAMEYNRLSRACISGMGLPYLEAYVEFEGEMCRRFVQSIKDEKERIYRRGINGLFKR